MEEYCKEGNDRQIEVPVTVNVVWNNQRVMEEVASSVALMVYKDIKPKVEKAVMAMLNDKVNLAILGVMDTEIQVVDKWGKAVGEKESVRSMLMRETEVWLTEAVDEYGRFGGDSYGARRPRIQWLFKQALNGKKDNRGNTDLSKIIVKSIKGIVGDVEDLVLDEVRQQVAERFKSVE